MEAAQSAGLPQAVLDLIASAPKYPEGRGVKLPVASDADVQAVLALARIKMAN